MTLPHNSSKHSWLVEQISVQRCYGEVKDTRGWEICCSHPVVSILENAILLYVNDHFLCFSGIQFSPILRDISVLSCILSKIATFPRGTIFTQVFSTVCDYCVSVMSVTLQKLYSYQQWKLLFRIFHFYEPINFSVKYCLSFLGGDGCSSDNLRMLRIIVTLWRGYIFI